MSGYSDDVERLDAMLAELEGSIAGAQSVTGAFRSEMEEVTGAMQVASRDAAGLSRSLGTNLKSAFQDLIFDGAKLSDVLSRAGQSLSQSVFSAAFRPVQDAFGSVVSQGISSLFGGFFAKGGAFSSGRVVPFARGGIVDRPTGFPMRGGMGLMGEAGPEAILPLARGADGRLGVRTSGGGGVNIVMNITTPDVAGFQKSRGQIAAGISRALGQGRRNL